MMRRTLSLAATAAVMLSASALTAYGVGTVDYCSPATPISSNLIITLKDDLTNHQGIGCIVSPGVRLTFDGNNPPSGFGLSVSFSEGTIGAGGSLRITFPNNNVAASALSIVMRIENSVFQQDAALYMSGSFPVSSLLSISGNTFQGVSAKNSVLGNVPGTYIAAMVFGQSGVEMQMYLGAQINVVNNVINVADRGADSSTNYDTYGVYFVYDIYATDGAGLLVRRNNITATSKSRSVGVYSPRYFFSVGNGTAVQISENNFDLQNGVMFVAPSIVSGNQTNNCDLSRNLGRLAPIHGSGNAIHLGPLNITAVSRYDVNDNIIINDDAAMTSYPTRIFLAGVAHIRGNASFQIGYNIMNVRGGSPQISFGAQTIIEGKATATVIGNEMERIDNDPLNLAPFSFFQLRIRGDAVMSFSQNIVGANNADTKPQLITVTSTTTEVSKEDTASFDVCHNTWYGAKFADDASLSATLNPRIRPLITPLSSCPGWITTTTTTTPKPTTLPTIPSTLPTTTQEDQFGRETGNSPLSGPPVVAGASLFALVAAFLL